MTPLDPDWRRWEHQLDPRRPDGDTLRAGAQELASALRHALELVRLALGLAIIGRGQRARLQLAPAPARREAAP